MNYETEIKSDLGDASDVKFAERGGFARFTTGKGRCKVRMFRRMSR